MTITSYAPRAKASLAAFPARERASLLAHPKAILFAVLALHFAAFSLIAILTQPTLPLDVIEQVSWARNPEWAYFKHPPLPAWCLAALMALTGGQPWIAALAGPAAATLALWIVWLLARRILDPVRALLSVLLLEGVVHFNVLSLEFNHNIIHLPLWAFIAYASHRAIRENPSPIGCCSASPPRLACSANTPRRSFDRHRRRRSVRWGGEAAPGRKRPLDRHRHRRIALPSPCDPRLLRL